MIDSQEIAGLGGRPEHVPTDQNRALVTLMAGMGARHVDIAAVIPIAEKTLRKHYTPELETGKAKMDAHVFKALYKGIEKGKTDLIKLYLERKCGWKADAPDPGAGVAVAVHLSLGDMIKQISASPPAGIPDFSEVEADRAKSGLTIDHNPQGTT